LPKSPKKTYAISLILAKILPVPISPNVPISPKMPNIAEFFEINNANYFVGVMNDVILMIEFPKFTLYNLNSIAFGGVLNSTNYGESLHSNLL
jgi:hypothetical protein